MEKIKIEEAVGGYLLKSGEDKLVFITAIDLLEHLAARLSTATMKVKVKVEVENLPF